MNRVDNRNQGFDAANQLFLLYTRHNVLATTRSLQEPILEHAQPVRTRHFETVCNLRKSIAKLTSKPFLTSTQCTAQQQNTLQHADVGTVV